MMPREIFFRGSLTADLSLRGDLPPRSKPKQPRRPREKCRVCKGGPCCLFVPEWAPKPLYCNMLKIADADWKEIKP